MFYIVFARLKGDILLGEFSIAVTYASFALVLVLFGLDRVVLRTISQQPSVTKKILINVFRTQTLIWITILPFIIFFVFLFDYSKQVKQIIWCLSLFWILPSALYLTVHVAHQGLLHMRTSSILNIISAAQFTILGLIVLFFDGGLLWISVVMVWERASTALIGIVLIHRHNIPKPLDTLPNFSKNSLLREGLPFVGLGLFGSLYQRIDILMMPMFVSDADIGQYATAYRMLEVLLVLPASIATAAFPLMAKTINIDFSKYYEVAGKSLRYSLAIAGLVVGVLFVFAEPIIILIFGEGFLPSARLFQILIWGVFFQSINNTLGRSIIAAGLEIFFIPLAILALISNVLLNFYLLPRMGAMGAGISTLGSYAFSSFMHCLIVWKYHVMPEWRKSLLTILSFIFSGATVLLFSQSHGIYSGVIVGILIYIVCLFHFKVVSYPAFGRQSLFLK